MLSLEIYHVGKRVAITGQAQKQRLANSIQPHYQLWIYEFTHELETPTVSPLFADSKAANISHLQPPPHIHLPHIYLHTKRGRKSSTLNSLKCLKKWKMLSGNSLSVLWVGLCAFTGCIPLDQELDPTSHATQSKRRSGSCFLICW